MQCARTLNTHLVRTPKEQIALYFKFHLPTVIKEHLMAENPAIFRGVPAETTEDLKKTFDQLMRKGMPVLK